MDVSLKNDYLLLLAIGESVLEGSLPLYVGFIIFRVPLEIRNCLSLFVGDFFDVFSKVLNGVVP